MIAARFHGYLVAAGIALAALATIGRTMLEARTEIDVAHQHDAAGAPLLAVEHYRRALRWSFPLSPHTAQAVSALERIARELEHAGDVDGALLAWRSLSGGLGAARFFYSSANSARQRAEDEITRILAQDNTAPASAGLPAGRLSADRGGPSHREAVADPFWGTVLLLGFLLWVASLISMTRRGFDSEGRLRLRDARWPASAALIGVVSWVLGLIFA